MWLGNLFATRKAGASRAAVQWARRDQNRRRPAGCRLAVETLDDRRVPASLSVSDFSIIEGDVGTRNAQVTVSLSAPSNPPVTVNYSTANGTAIAGRDYQAVTGTLTFGKGVTSKSILVPIVGDVISEPNETFFVNLKNAKHATIADGQGVGTIVDDDTRVNISDVTVKEGDSDTTDFTFTVTLTAASGQPVTVDYATADGTATAGSDYVSASGSLTIPAGQTNGTVTVQVKGDRLSESDETFFVNLSNPINALVADGQGVGTIADNEPRVNISNPVLLEGDAGTATMSFDVGLQVAYDLPVTVSYATADGTATAGEDYVATSGTVTFLPGQTLQSIAVAVNGDRLPEQDETLLVNLTTADSYTTLTTDHGVGLIADNEPHITIYDAWQDYYGTSITFTVYLAVPYDQAVTVDFYTLDGTAVAGVDFVPTSGTLTFNPGETSATFTVELLTFDPGAYRYFNVQLSNPSSNALLVNDWAYGTWYDDSF
jgi:hypothetical protein